jgi:hypothetical protein
MTQNIEELFLKNANSYTDSYNSVPAMTLEDFTEAIKFIHPEFIKKIDWRLLREQKGYLLRKSNPHSYEKGLIHLIDSLQDFACDEMGLTEKEVFNLNEEEDLK